MSEISERYGRLSQAFADKIAAVREQDWTRPSPCEGWTARDVVEHVISTQGMFLGFVGESTPEAAKDLDDPAAAWDAARNAVQAQLDDPDRAAAEFDGFTGRSTFEAAVGRFLCVDLVVHGWDLARAVGLDDTLEPQDIVRVQETTAAFGEALRGPRAFGPAVSLPPDASAQDQLLAFLGRRP